MARLLTVFKTVIFFGVAAVVSIPFILLAPLALIPGRWGWPIVVGYLWMLLFLLKWICGLTYEIRGLENIPKTPCLIASRHESTWENLFFQILLDNPAIFVKKEIFSYPVAGIVARKNQHILTDRSGNIAAIRASFDKALNLSRQGRNILIYPSGTRRNEQRYSVKTGVVALYNNLGCACVPVVLNSGEFWPLQSWMKYPGKIIVQILPAIPPGLNKEEFLRRITYELSKPVVESSADSMIQNTGRGAESA